MALEFTNEEYTQIGVKKENQKLTSIGNPGDRTTLLLEGSKDAVDYVKQNNGGKIIVYNPEADVDVADFKRLRELSLNNKENLQEKDPLVANSYFLEGGVAVKYANEHLAEFYKFYVNNSGYSPEKIKEEIEKGGIEDQYVRQHGQKNYLIILLDEKGSLQGRINIVVGEKAAYIFDEIPGIPLKDGEEAPENWQEIEKWNNYKVILNVLLEKAGAVAKEKGIQDIAIIAASGREHIYEACGVTKTASKFGFIGGPMTREFNNLKESYFEKARQVECVRQAKEKILAGQQQIVADSSIERTAILDWSKLKAENPSQEKSPG